MQSNGEHGNASVIMLEYLEDQSHLLMIMRSWCSRSMVSARVCPLPQKGNIVHWSTPECGKVYCQVLLKWLFLEEQKMFSLSLLVISVFIILYCQGQYLVLGTIYFLCAERNIEQCFPCSIFLTQGRVMPRKIFLWSNWKSDGSLLPLQGL